MATAEAPARAAAILPRREDVVVRIEGLSKAFPVRRGWSEILRHPLRKPGTTTVLSNVSFDVRRAEFFGLLGANGAGKTTLFRILGTQLLPDAGTATVAGADILRDPREVRALLTRVVADERSLNWRLTARENLELFAVLYDIPRTQRHDRVAEVLEAVELQDTGNKMVGSFSSGMRQRLLIARALLPRPRVLLLDEPTRSLDPVSARRFREFLRSEIAGRQQCTVLLATHSAEEALELCDRLAVLHRGRVLATGTADELMSDLHDDTYHITLHGSQVDYALRVFPDATVVQSSSAGWMVVELKIRGGPDGAAEVVSNFTRAGISVAGLEHRPLSLADILEGTVRLKSES